MTLKAIKIQGFDSDSKASARLNRSSSVLLHPSFKDTTKATFSEKTFGSEISCSQLEIKESKLLEVRIHLKLFTIGVDKELSALVVVAIVEEEETGPAGCSFDFTVAADLLPNV